MIVYFFVVHIIWQKTTEISETKSGNKEILTARNLCYTQDAETATKEQG